MSTSPDIRLPCGRTTSVPERWRGGCGQQYDARLAGVQVKRNVTRMVDYHSGSQYTSSGVDPYAWAEQFSAPDCSPYNAGGCPGNPCYVCGDIGGTGNGNLPCGTPPTSSILVCGNGTSSFAVGPYHNCYVPTNETTSFAHCRNLGFKNAYARKLWQGRHCYNSRTIGQYDSWVWCVQCGEHYEDTTPDTTRYLAISATSHITYDSVTYTCSSSLAGSCFCGDIEVQNYCPSCEFSSEFNIAASAGAGSSVDSSTGTMQATCTSASSGCPGPDPGPCNKQYADAALALTALASGDANAIFNKWNAMLTAFAFYTPTVTGGGSSWHVEWHVTQECLDHCGLNPVYNDVIIGSMTMDTIAGTITAYTFAPNTNYCGRTACTCDDCCPPYIQTSAYSLNYGCTSMAYSYDVTGIGSISLDQTYHEDCAGSLSSPYTSHQVYEKVVSLLSNLPLDRDDLLPWRTDANVTMGPFCYMDEVMAYPVVPSCTGSLGGTGATYGIPGPAGLDQAYNPVHENWCICDSLVNPGCRAAYIQSRGAWNTGIGGGSATAWLNSYEATSVPQGAFVGNGFFYTVPNTCNSTGPQKIIDNGMWIGKYAEIVFPKPSVNYARPCGPDRFQISQSSARCVTGSIGNTLVLESTGPAADITTGNYVWVCGVTGLEGCWIATKDSDYVITLQEPRIVSASVLPTQPFDNCGTGMIAKLRWQNLQPAICGRLDVVSATPTNPITITLESPTYLVNNDYIWIVNASGGNINGYWKVTVVDSSTVILSGSNGISASYQGHGQAYSPFAADWRWNDSQTKNEFQILKWDYNFRDVGEYARISQSVPFIQAQYQCDPPTYTPCAAPTVPPEPRVAQKVCGMDQNVSNMTCETRCIKYTACSPVVAFFSPNSESFANSGSGYLPAVNYGFHEVSFDDQYGSMWQGMVKQAIDDPFWQAPPCPCQSVTDPDTLITTWFCDCTWTQDDGNCNADVVSPCQKYYAKAPQLEARCEVPSGSPALPTGIKLGCLTSADFVSGSACPTNKNICSAPFADSYAVYNSGNGCSIYYPYRYATPWITLLAEIGCVCNAGRFATDYRNLSGVYCDDSVLPPP